MVQINFAQKTINAKIVYYGPGMSGKTTNLEVVHQRAPEGNRGDLTSISTDGDRTLFFDYMPLDLGTVAGMRTCFQLYTVPGQVYYNSTRKLVLQGVDGVIFVADSSASMTEQNLESLRNLEENLNEYGKSLATMPHVVQFNKRDLPDAMDLEELNRLLNPHGAPTFEAVANTGQGVFPTLKALAAGVMRSITQEAGGKKSPAAAAPAPPPAVPRPAPVADELELATPKAPAAHVASPAAHAPAAPPSGPSYAPPAGGSPLGHGGGSGLDVAEPRSVAPNPASRAAARPAAPPRSGGGARPAHRPAKKPATHAPARQRRASSPPRTTVSAPRKKGGGIFTSLFVILAAGAGAAIAWVVLKNL